MRAGSLNSKNELCGICYRKTSLYTCPKCDLSYCSLQCYNSEKHVFCSEDFYKQEVIDLLKRDKKSSSRSFENVLNSIHQLDKEEYNDAEFEEEENLLRALEKLDVEDAGFEATVELLSSRQKQEFKEYMSKVNDSLINISDNPPWWLKGSGIVLPPRVRDVSSSYVSSSLGEDPFLEEKRESLRKLPKLARECPTEFKDYLFNGIVEMLLAYIYCYRYMNNEPLSSPNESTCVCLALSKVIHPDARVIYNTPLDEFSSFLSNVVSIEGRVFPKENISVILSDLLCIMDNKISLALEDLFLIFCMRIKRLKETSESNEIKFLRKCVMKLKFYYVKFVNSTFSDIWSLNTRVLLKKEVSDMISAESTPKDTPEDPVQILMRRENHQVY